MCVCVQLAPAFVIIFLMFSGYFLNENSIPVYVSWMKYISFIRYAFQVRSSLICALGPCCGSFVNPLRMTTTVFARKNVARSIRVHYV